MAWAAPEADVFMFCMLKRREGEQKAAGRWIGDLVDCVRQHRGKFQLLSSKPENWEVFEGKDHQVEPNHLNPAVFDFDAIVLAAFPDENMISAWWDSDAVFELMKSRKPIDALSIFTVDGLDVASDVSDAGVIAFGAKYMLFEFHKMLSFKPVQQYCDNYRRYCEATRVHTMISDSVKNVFVNEYPLDAVCATSWKQVLDAKAWRYSDIFQGTMVPLREQHSLCLGLMVPMYEASTVEFERARKTFAVKDTMKTLAQADVGGVFTKKLSEGADIGKGRATQN